MAVLAVSGLAVAAALLVRTRPAEADWREVAPGVAHRSVRLPGGVAGEAVLVDLERAEVRVVDALAEGAPRTARALREGVRGAVAAFNGGFFDASGEPMGLVLADGEVRNTLRRADWGVFWVSADRAGIVHTRTWSRAPRADARHALQAGPRLVVAGRPVRLKAQAARRTVVCTRSPTEVVLLVSGTVGARPLAAWLAEDSGSGGLGCLDALNLDGGPSTQFSLSAGDLSVDLGGGWPVPNGLVVVPGA